MEKAGAFLVFCVPKGRTSELPRVERSATRGLRAAHDDRKWLDPDVSTGFAALHPWQVRGAALRDAEP